MNSSEVLDRLKSGNERFVSDRLSFQNNDSSRREAVTSGQDPFAIVLSCADSRVVPELIFDTGIGDLFVVRVAGNIANTSSIASIEYAVAHLNASLLVVLGHENCGAINAAMTGGDKGANLNHLMGHLEPVLEGADAADKANDIARSNAMQTINDLTIKSSIIENALKENRISLVPAYYHLRSGRVEFL